MIPELSVTRISVDGSDFGTIPKDADNLSDVDRLQSLGEAEQGRYSSFFVIERDTKSEATEGGLNDLRALRDCTGGVYILISSRLSEQNRRSVFIGITGFNEKMFGPYEQQTGINLQLEDTDRFMTLTQCLKEQNENAPKNMKYWDLAIVIPEEEHALQISAVIYFILDKAEGFILRTNVNEKASDELSYMNIVSQRYLSSMQNFTFTSSEHLLDFLYNVPEGILEAVLNAIVKNIIKKPWKKNSRKSKIEEKKEQAEDSDLDANDDSEDSDDAKFFDKIVKSLNKYFPRKFNSSQRRKKKPNDDFAE